MTHIVVVNLRGESDTCRIGYALSHRVHQDCGSPSLFSSDRSFVLLHSIVSAHMKKTIPPQLSGLEGVLKKESDIIDGYEVKCLICTVFT